jgi:predicted transcriptional regulator
MTWYTQGRLLKVAGVEHLKGEEPLSRGHGAVERAILDDLAHNKCAIVEDLARSVAGTADPNFAISDALRSSINRTLRKLAHYHIRTSSRRRNHRNRRRRDLRRR